MVLGDFFKFIFQFTGRRNTLERDIHFLKSQIKPLKDKLIPFSVSEMGLLSHQQSYKTGRTDKRAGVSGLMDTIYYEHLMAFGAKKFNRKYTLLLVESTEDTFIYIYKENIFHVIMNDVEAGHIDSRGTFFNKSRQPIAYWNWAATAPTQPIEVMGKKIGVINNPLSEDVTTPRLLNLFSEPTEDEWSILMCLVLGKLIDSQ